MLFVYQLSFIDDLRENRNKVAYNTDSNFLRIGTLNSNLRTVKEIKISYRYHTYIVYIIFSSLSISIFYSYYL